MQQLTQKLKNGDMKVLEVPLPLAGPGLVRVRTHYSLISAGTEGSTVKAARKSLLGKAKERPQQVRQVLDTLKSQGPVQTFRAVMKKLDAYSPLGYSCAGEVIDAPAGSRFKPGDRVACGGLTATHAQVNSVPENLCVPLAPGADLKQAAYNTLGAIALQGVRQADLKLGETCTVIGLGLLGQITALLLRASGVKVIGVDIDPVMVDFGRKYSLDHGFARDEAGISEKIHDLTQGLGCDGVIITAASSSLDPVNFAGAVSRKRGRVVIVGDVPTGFDRDPHFYKKELQLNMSCSYGPGRYDPLYEERGIDYPAAYVRWTENRNMQAFQDLISQGRINLNFLTTHCFPLESSLEAYGLIMEKSQPFIGILIAHDVETPLDPGPVQLLSETDRKGQSQSVIGFMGAGSYAQSHLLPHICKHPKAHCKGVLTQNGISSRSVAERFCFDFCTHEADDILDNDQINTVFIASRHDSHARLTRGALERGKHVFVEKPLCLIPEDLVDIIAQAGQEGAPGLMVGYNRRFAPLAGRLKEAVGDGPMSMCYRVNAGNIPKDSWIQDQETGGGRIIGEACHFIDFLTYINGSLPLSVHATAMADARNLEDTVAVNLTFANGSIGSLLYLANGDKGLAKERIEIFSRGSSAVLEDFKKLTLYREGKKQQFKGISQDKGQKQEIRAFLDGVVSGGPLPISLEELHATSAACFAVIESLRTGESIFVRG